MLIFLGVLIIGLSKAGFKGLAPIGVVIFALSYGAKPSLSIVLPLIIFGDILALLWYHKKVDYGIVKRFLPWVVIGLVLSAIWGKNFDYEFFNKAIGILLTINILVLFVLEFFLSFFPGNNRWTTILLGIGSGIYSMLGNFAGVFANTFFILSKLPKNQLIGSATFIFFVANLIKVPLHLSYWETMNIETIKTIVPFLPVFVVSFIFGAWAITKINEKLYRVILYTLSPIAVIVYFIFNS